MQVFGKFADNFLSPARIAAGKTGKTNKNL